jgi:hypothetical protein
MYLTNGELCWNCFKSTQDIDSACAYINGFLESNGFEKLSSKHETTVKLKLKSLRTNFNKKYKKFHAKWDESFDSKHIQFLQANFPFEFKFTMSPSSNVTQKLGRKPKQFRNKGKKGKYLIASRVARENNYDSIVLLEAALLAAKKKKIVDLIQDLKVLLDKKRMKKGVKKVKKTDIDDTLHFFIDNNLGQRQYRNLTKFCTANNNNIFPSYEKLLDRKKKCYPEGIVVNEMDAFVPLQKLLVHTIDEILKFCEKEIDGRIIDDSVQIGVTFEVSLGMDGSSGHSIYNQHIAHASSKRDANLFIVSMMPLGITRYDFGDVWKSPSPGSVRFNRPVSMKFQPESDELTKVTYNNLIHEINNLTIHEYTLPSGKILIIGYKCVVSMVDGKVLKVLTGTSSCQACFICKCKPKDFNNINNLENGMFDPQRDALIFGASPLHAWICCYNCFYNVATKKPVQKYYSSTNALVIEKKSEIDSLLLEKLNIVPSAFSTGNVARKSFGNCDVFAECLGFDNEEKELISKMHTILMCFSCHFRISVNKFKEFCRDFFHLWVKKFAWHPMSSTLHKLIVHGHQIIQHSSIPLGYLTEESAESSNKLYRAARINHALKTSREITTHDVFHRRMVESSPAISLKFAYRSMEEKLLNLPIEVVRLLDLSPDEIAKYENFHTTSIRKEQNFDEFFSESFWDDIINAENIDSE